MSTSNSMGPPLQGACNPWNQLPNMMHPAFIAYFNAMNQLAQQNEPSQKLVNPSKAPQPQPLIPEINQNSPQDQQPRKRTRNNSQAKPCTTSDEPSQNNSKQNFIVKFTSKKQFPPQLKGYLSLDRELKRCLPHCTIINAYINKRNELVIKSNSEENTELIKSTFPNDAFVHGVDAVRNKEPKFYLLNFSLDFDITDSCNLYELQTRHDITKALRIVKKSTKEPLKTIKALINNRESFEKIVKAGKIQIGSTIVKARPWKFDIQADQCFHCQKIGHMKSNCPHLDEIQLVSDAEATTHMSIGTTHHVADNALPSFKKLTEKRYKSNRKQAKPSNPNVHLENFAKSMLNLLIDTIKLFNQVTESIEENPQFFVNLVNKNLGPNYAKFVMNKLVAEQQENHNMSSNSDEDKDIEFDSNDDEQ
ncbi:hypothetical protein BpHYR1_043462 [Brachionus plicatilis]|uniref:CCHC-type domain-containing protein n=1 Tax=Brachionus plicatilis TaxID=10195 RepID=A0A3M7T7F1_BRAPC|nr:hypothetical protein BpHYR1_043462 [Brachionus plicatilis]